MSGPIVVADALPVGVKFTGASGGGWACGVVLRTVLCARAGGLSVGQSTSLVLNVTVSAKSGTVLTNSATAAAATQESNRSNNTAAITTTVTR